MRLDNWSIHFKSLSFCTLYFHCKRSTVLYNLSLLQSIIQKKTSIRRQRRDVLQQNLREQREQSEQKKAYGREQQPLKQVDNYSSTPHGLHQSTVPSNGHSPMKSPSAKADTHTVAFGRTTKVSQVQRSPTSRSHVRRYSLENDSVS